MKVSEFDYTLPNELIAQTPIENRSHSRLLMVDKQSNQLHHKHFYDIVDSLDASDVLVINDTKVMPARIFGRKQDTNAHIECLILKEKENLMFEVLLKPMRRIKKGTKIVFSEALKAEVIAVFEQGLALVQMKVKGIFIEELERLGQMPLPPYIHERLEDQNRYQTVYASHLGSAAAPTAGLHFTSELLERLNKKGVEIVRITLHVGLGTFRPISADTIFDHVMHHESFEITQEAAIQLNRAKETNKRIIAVGTTSVRTLEAVMNKHERFCACRDQTDLFIYPGYRFKAVDAMITNFHLPKSTLLMLVSAFASKDIIFNAYREAIKEKYRFFSFGDAMFIQ